MKPEGSNRYEVACKNNDCQWLLTYSLTSKTFVIISNTQKIGGLVLVGAKATIFNCRQGPNQPTTDYFETFKELVLVLESYGQAIP
jgi:hypothetical protein